MALYFLGFLIHHSGGSPHFPRARWWVWRYLPEIRWCSPEHRYRPYRPPHHTQRKVKCQDWVLARIEHAYHPHNLRDQLALEARVWISIQNLASRAGWARRLWRCYPYSICAKTQSLYFTLPQVWWEGSVRSISMLCRASSNLWWIPRKSSTGSREMRRTTRTANQKPLKNTGPPGTTFLLRKKFWVCKNRTMELRDLRGRTLSIICRGVRNFLNFLWKSRLNFVWRLMYSHKSV